MANPCVCATTLQNLGVCGCKDLQNVIRRLIFVPEYNLAGVKNEITNVAGVIKSALEAKYDAAVIENRFFPLPIVENVENARPDPLFQEFNSGTKAKIREQYRHIIAYIPVGQGASPQLYNRLKSLECNNGGFYMVDRNGNFIFITDRTTKTKVQPILYEKDSMSISHIPATETAVQMIKIEFDVRFSMDDGLLRYIPAESLDFDALIDPYSLNDVVATYTDITDESFTATLKTDCDELVRGLVKADFALYNVTDTAAIELISVTETSRGVYSFLFASQTEADVARLTPTKARFDFSAVVTNTIVLGTS